MISSGRGGLWRRADFVRLWGAGTAWLSGAEVAELALPTLAIIGFAASPTQAGLLVAAPWLAFLVVGLPVGALIDRLSRKRVMIAASLGRFVTLILAPAAFAAGHLTLPWLYVIAGVAGVLGVFTQVAYRSLLPVVVTRDELLDGNAKLILGEGAAKVAGPSITGFAIQLVGAAGALLASAGGSLVAALLLRRLPDDQPTRRSPRLTSIAGDACEGLAFVLGQSTLTRLVSINTLGNLGTGMVEGVALVFAYRELRLDVATVGLAMAAGSAGFLASATTSHRITRLLGTGPTLVASCLVFAVAPFALCFGSLGFPLVALVVWRLLYGISLPPYDIIAATMRQMVTPDRLQGRAIAAINTIGWGALGLGPILGGILGERIGLLPTILVGGPACLLGVIPALLPRLLEFDDPVLMNESAPF